MSLHNLLPTERGTFQKQHLTFLIVITVSFVFICSCLCSAVFFLSDAAMCAPHLLKFPNPRVLLAGAGASHLREPNQLICLGFARSAGGCRRILSVGT
jgi:hypothetical protein